MMKFPDAVALEPWQIACLNELVAAVRDELERGQLTCQLTVRRDWLRIRYFLQTIG